MANKNKCKAKNPDACWKHGKQLPGGHAYTLIKQSLSVSDETFLATVNITSAPLKQMGSGALATEIYSHALRSTKMRPSKIKKALLLASDLHQPDTRSTRADLPQSPYIEHPLRNALRSIRYGADDEVTVIGNILHDTIEDHPFEFASKYAKKEFSLDDEHEARIAALAYIRSQFGTETSKMVEGMSNPISLGNEHKFSPAAERNKIYADHVEEAIQNPYVCIGKTCDFIDNAVGLHHNARGDVMNKTGIVKRAKKYLPVCDILEKRLMKAKLETHFPASQEGIDAMLRQIRTGRTRLHTLLTVFE